MSGLITFPVASGYWKTYVVCCVIAKGAHIMLNHMRELQKRFTPMPDHTEELVKIEQIFNELRPRLECGGARLRCLLDTEKKLQEETVEENFAAGFALGWEIRKGLQDAGVLSAHDGEGLGIVISEGR